MASRTTYQTHFLLGAKVQSSMNKSFSKVQKNMKNIRKSAGYTEGTFDKLGRSLRNAFAAAGIYFSARTIVTALNDSTQAAMEFEDQMADVGTLLDGEVNQKIAKYGKQVKQTAIDTGISTEQLNSGLYETISALGDGADTYEIFRKAAENARGGNADVQNVVKFLSTTMKGYGDVSAETAEKVSDLGFQTVKLGQTTFPELAQNMGDVVPLAGSMGAEMESVFGAMATLTGVTGDTAKVSTQLRGVFSALTKPTSRMKEVINGLGYESGAAMVKAKGFQGTLDLLKKVTGGSTEELGKMFGRVEALNAVIALTGTQSENFTKKTEAMYNAVGASNEAFKEKVKTSKALRERFGQLINILRINLGNKVLPYINQGLEYILENYKEMGAQARAAMQPVVKTYNFIKNNWSAIEPIVVGITSAMIAYKTTQIALTAAQKAGMIVQSISKAYSTFQATMNAARYSTLAASKAQVALNLAMSANPAAVIAIAIGALATAGYLLYKNWDKILPKLQAFYNLIKDVPAVRAFIDTIISVKDSAIQTFNGIVTFVKGVFTADWEKAWTGAKNAFAGIFNIKKTLIKAPLDMTLGIFKTGFDAINNLVGFDIGEKARSSLAAARTNFNEFVNNFNFDIAGKAQEHLTNFKDVFSNKLTEVKNYLNQFEFGQQFLQNIDTLLTGAKNYFNGIVTFVKGVFTADWEKAWTGAVQAISAPFSTMSELVKQPMNASLGLINSALDQLNKINVEVPKWVPGMGGKNFGFDIPKIPMLAKGTDNFGGGMAVVGERGPELVNMPQGTQVTTATKTETLIQKLKETPSKATEILNNLKNTVVNKEINLTFAPNVTIEGNADKEDVKRGIIETKADFEELLNEFLGDPRADFS